MTETETTTRLRDANATVVLSNPDDRRPEALWALLCLALCG